MEVLDRFSSKFYTQVRLVGGHKGNEVVSIDEALRRASDEGLDLILVGPDSKPPVVKIQDFKKIQYEAKKAKSKHQRVSTTKEIQLKLNISDHDLNTKINAIKKFLERGDKVKANVRFKGRERENPERAQELFDKILLQVTCKSSRVRGPSPIMILEKSTEGQKPKN